jgi:hypothetical protein
MPNGRMLHITFPNFFMLFDLIEVGKNFPKLHDEGLLEPQAMYFMYGRGDQAYVGKAKGLCTYYAVFNRLLRMTLTPKDGDPSDVTNFQKKLMRALSLEAPLFSAGDFIWQEIKNLSEDPRKICSYSPYIMHMIERVSRLTFPKDVKHKPL